MGKRSSVPPFVPVGYDYQTAIQDLRKVMTADEIAQFIGYDSRNTVYYIARGGTPAHPQGEALYVLYLQKLGKKPPMTQQQASGSFARILGTRTISPSA